MQDDTPSPLPAEKEPRPTAQRFFDECEVYFELPLNGNLEDVTEFLSGYDEEVRLAACAFAEAYANKVMGINR